MYNLLYVFSSHPLEVGSCVIARDCVETGQVEMKSGLSNVPIQYVCTQFTFLSLTKRPFYIPNLICSAHIIMAGNERKTKTKH